MKLRYPFAAALLGLVIWAAWPDAAPTANTAAPQTTPTPENGRDVIILPNPLNPSASATQAQAAQASPPLVVAARSQIGKTLEYDPAYTVLTYPMGDVAMQKGVCTDVVIRALRTQGLDLQQLVHEDMREHFAAYPKLWNLTQADANIDHRRVPNLRRYFERHDYAVQDGRFQAGDIITWDLGKGLVHIGIASDKNNAQGEPLIIHNIGRGTQEEDILHRFKMTGHYRIPTERLQAPQLA